VVGGAILIVLFIVIASRYRKAPPNKALIVYGTQSFKCVYGGGTFVWPIFQQVATISLEVMTLDVTTPEVYTSQGVPIMVDGVAQVKIDGTEEMIRTAAEQFLDKSPGEVMNVALQTVEGHLRAILGTMTVEEAYSNRDAFAQRVQDVAASDLVNMGLRIVSFTIRDIRDKHGYLDALGKPRTAQVKRDATIGEAEAERDATIRSAAARQAGEEAKYAAETEIAEAQKGYQIKAASYKKEVQQSQADADLSYELQKNRTSQEVKREEIKVQVVEKEGMIDVETKEIARRQKELEADVERPADAERYRMQALAEGQRSKYTIEAEGQAEASRRMGEGEADAERAKGLAQAEVEKARGLAEAEVQRARGLAEGDAVRAKGFAEAESMMKKAEAWRNYNQAAVIERVVEVLPEIASAVASPLAKTDRIVMVSGGNGDGVGAAKLTKDVTSIISELPPVVEALSGVDVEKLLQSVPGISDAMTQPAPAEGDEDDEAPGGPDDIPDIPTPPTTPTK
jgi:flotillin